MFLSSLFFFVYGSKFWSTAQTFQQTTATTAVCVQENSHFKPEHQLHVSLKVQGTISGFHCSVCALLRVCDRKKAQTLAENFLKKAVGVCACVCERGL